MTEKKRREKVVAEITLAHLLHLAQENGCPWTEEQALTFLNQDGRAYAMWKQMMHAGEDYFKTTLESEYRALRLPRAAQRSRMIV